MFRILLVLMAVYLVDFALATSVSYPNAANAASADHPAEYQPEPSARMAPHEDPRQWALMTNGRGKQGALPELMAIKVCEKIARFIETDWRDTAICANLTTGEIRKMTH